MEENLVGYLLKSLDADTQRQVEASLQTSPELRTRLDLLERALAPLAADADTPEPPPGLVLATLAHIAEHQCRKLPPAPPPPRSQLQTAGRQGLRRADVLVAALLLIVFGGICSSGIVHLWRDYRYRVDCENNLAVIGRGLQLYCDNHDGNFPRVEEHGPRSVAGIFVPILCESGALGPETSMICPAQGGVGPRVLSLRELEELYEKDRQEFHREARKLAGSYAYSLGYRDGNVYYGLRCDLENKQHLAIVADRLESLEQSNSPNHGGDGQNVLFLDGRVIWCTRRTVGLKGDDIFSNWDNHVLAGKAPEDTVLGPGDASPTPKE